MGSIGEEMEPFVEHIREENQPQLFELKPWILAHPDLSAGFTGRDGGVSQIPYNSLNLALHVWDDPEAVLENRRKVADSLGFRMESWTCGEQTHGSQVAVVTAADAGRGRMDRASAFQETDAMVTNVPGILLTSFYADCVPLYFFDPVYRVVGIAHAGWRGTVKEIARKTIEVMQQTYGSIPSELYTAIGPSIGDCCYEVDEAVMTHVRPLIENVSSRDGEDLAYKHSTEQGRFMLNLKELNRMIMIKAGILPSHIECTTWCTSTNCDLFFSYRKGNGQTGRMASWIGLKER